jgi:hypothetical protein
MGISNPYQKNQVHELTEYARPWNNATSSSGKYERRDIQHWVGTQQPLSDHLMYYLMHNRQEMNS